MPIDPSKVIWDNNATVTPTDKPDPSRVVWDSPQSDDMSWGEVGTSALKNIPSSSVKFAKDLAYPAMHPVETLKGLYALGKGGIQKAIPGEQGGEVAFDAFTDAVMDRYGGIDELKNTLATDPVGVLADVASIFSGGGAALQGVGLASKTGRLSQAGKLMSGVANKIEPTLVAGRTVGKIGDIAGVSPSELAQSAVKYSTTLTPEQRAQQIRLQLDKGVFPNAWGSNRIRNARAKLGNKRDRIIQEGWEQRGDTIPRETILDYTDRTLENAVESSPTPGRDLDAIERVQSEFRGHPKDIPSPQVQAIKQSTQGRVKESRYGKDVPSAEVNTFKDIAYGARKELESLYPQLKKLNKDDAAWKLLGRSIDKAANRISNRNMLSLGTLLAGASGAAVGDWKGALLGMSLKMTLESPNVKTALAIALHQANKAAGKTGMKQALPYSAMYQAGKGAQTQE